MRVGELGSDHDVPWSTSRARNAWCSGAKTAST
jgi:hypothetical protein